MTFLITFVAFNVSLQIFRDTSYTLIDSSDILSVFINIWSQSSDNIRNSSNIPDYSNAILSHFSGILYFTTDIPPH